MLFNMQLLYSIIFRILPKWLFLCNMNLPNRYMYRTVPNWLLLCNIQLLNDYVKKTIPNWRLCHISFNCLTAISTEEDRTDCHIMKNVTAKQHYVQNCTELLVMLCNMQLLSSNKYRIVTNCLLCYVSCNSCTALCTEL